MSAPCADDPEIFYPEGFLGKPDPDDPVEPLDYHSEAAMRARNLCVACPFRTSCLEGAKERQEPYGIWGGLDPTEIMKEVAKDALQRMR